MMRVLFSLRHALLIATFFGLNSDALAQDELAVRSRKFLGTSTSLDYGPGDVYVNIPKKDELGRDQHAMFREWNPDPVGDHEANLKAINPVLAEVVRKAQAKDPSLQFVIGSGKRDYKLQRKAVAWGWSKTQDSSHRSGDAVDLWPLDTKGRIHFDPRTQIRIAAALQKTARELKVPIRWGGHFRSFQNMDRSHFELTRLAHPRRHGRTAHRLLLGRP